MPAAEASSRRPRGRPPVIATDRVLAIAREVFLERGIRATTAEVAARARVSEGILFHRFGSKDALFRAAMDFDPSVEPAVLAELPALVGKGDLRANLRRLGERLLELGSVALPVMMMAWSNPKSEFSLERMSAPRSRLGRRAIDALRAFFAAEQARGRLARGADPDMLARAFFGGLHQHCMQEIIVPDDAERPPRARFVAGLVALLLDGAGVRPRPTRSKGPR